jgi:hypothetical protein
MSNKYQEILNNLRKNHFLSESGDNSNRLLNMVDFAVKNLLTHQGSGPIYPVFKKRKISEVANDSEIPTNYSFDQESLLSELSDSMQRSIKANSPYMVKTSSLSQASCTLQLTWKVPQN